MISFLFFVSISTSTPFSQSSRHKFFNTNNLWLNLPALKAALDAAPGGALKLPLIKNKKTVNPRDSSSTPVYQLETAMGSAIELFDGAGAVVVPRTRFAPVKTTNDLFVLRSDAYRLAEDATLAPTVDPLPLADLDGKHYKLVDGLDALVKQAPSLKECTSVKVVGPVVFPPGVTLRGSVLISNEAATPVELAPGTYADSVVALPAGDEAAAAAVAASLAAA